MKKNKTKKINFKSKWTEQKLGFKEMNLNLANPMVKASYVWSILSDQLEDILGPQIHFQWFRQVKPLVISDNVLILEVSNHFTTQWIHTHHMELIEILLSVIDKRMSCFFISQSDKYDANKTEKFLFEDATSQKKCQSED
jgi:chromosomal replication initiation ATPase DnaA